MPDLIQLKSPTLMDLIPPEIQLAISQSANLVKYSDGQLIHSRGSSNRGLSIVQSGAAQIGVMGVDGKFVIVGRLRPGESFGEFTLYTELPRTHDVSAAGVTEILQISESQFLRLEKRFPQLTLAILKSSLTRNYLLLEALDDLRRLTLKQRTAKIILSMSYAATNGEHDSVTVECRQQELADTLGVSRVSLNTTLKQLAQTGLIEPAYTSIVVPSVQGLESWIATHCSTTPLNWRTELMR